MSASAARSRIGMLLSEVRNLVADQRALLLGRGCFVDGLAHETGRATRHVHRCSGLHWAFAVQALETDDRTVIGELKRSITAHVRLDALVPDALKQPEGCRIG